MTLRLDTRHRQKSLYDAFSDELLMADQKDIFYNFQLHKQLEDKAQENHLENDA